jgi:hypothetical protein
LVTLRDVGRTFNRTAAGSSKLELSGDGRLLKIGIQGDTESLGPGSIVFLAQPGQRFLRELKQRHERTSNEGAKAQQQQQQSCKGSRADSEEEEAERSEDWDEGRDGKREEGAENDGHPDDQEDASLAEDSDYEGGEEGNHDDEAEDEDWSCDAEEDSSGEPGEVGRPRVNSSRSLTVRRVGGQWFFSLFPRRFRFIPRSEFQEEHNFLFLIWG